MALRIEYLLNGQRVMVVPCPKLLDAAKKDAKIGLDRFGADTAQIIDMDHFCKVVEVVKRP